MSTARIKALDLFAGTGWGVACKRLGIKEMGVEIMPEAVATRTANGMETVYNDVWDGLQLTEEKHREQYGPYGLLIASPPCQTFSLAGKGAGREALDEVLEAIELHAYKDADALLAFGEKHDMRTALVLTPLAYIWRDMPKLVALEQVPTVLPVWEACADVMREWGYEVKVEVLNAEQYGVPQTRKRAILVARRGGPVDLPTPTHSRYYSRTPDKLDPVVKKWVSMAEALGWGAIDQPSHTITAGVHGPTDRFASGGSSVRKQLDAKIGSPEWIDKPNQIKDARTTYGQRFDVEDVAALQSYPTVFRNGNQAHAAKRPLDAPAPTIMFGARSNKVEWIESNKASDPAASGIRVTVDEASALQSYPTEAVKNMGRGMVERYGDRPGRSIDNPAFTVRASAGGTEPGGFIWKNEDESTRKTTAFEVGTLQTYEPPFIWCGTKTKQFLQIGNAVPPLLAEHILAALIGIPTVTNE